MLTDLILPLLCMLSLGYVSFKWQWVNQALITGLSQFIIKIALPAFLVAALARKNLQQLWLPDYMFAYALGSLLCFWLAFGVYRRVFQATLTQASVLAMGASMSNTGFIGSALMMLLLGTQGAIYLSLSLIIENLCVVAVMLTLAEAGQHRQMGRRQLIQQTAVKLAQNPIMLAIAVGMVLAALELPLPQGLFIALERVGQTASPLALFVIGAGLVGISLRAIDIKSGVLVSFKLLLMPLCIFALLYGLDASPETLYAGTLLAALPMPISFALFAEHYGMKQQALAPLMLSTVLGFPLLALLLSQWQF